MRATDGTNDELHRGKYPSGAKIEIVNLADGKLLLVVKPPHSTKKPLTKRCRKLNTV